LEERLNRQKRTEYRRSSLGEEGLKESGRRRHNLLDLIARVMDVISNSGDPAECFRLNHEQHEAGKSKVSNWPFNL
jgi:hypothetical protein